MTGNPPSPLRARMQSVAAYGLAAVLCVLILIWSLNLRRADLNVPIVEQADGYFSQVLVKGAIENGWYLHNDRLGAPFVQDMTDFPLCESGHVLCTKLLALTGQSPSWVFNVYFFLGFPLTTLTTLFVLRHFGISYVPALAAGLVFAFTPYHLLRGENHYFLACYYLVPLAVMVVMWIFEGRTPFFRVDGDPPRLRWTLRDRTTLGAAAICLLMGCGGVYYAFFTCVFLAMAGVAASIRQRRPWPLYSTALLAGLIVVVALVQISPTIVKSFREGKNPECAARSSLGGEIYGLRISQMLLPVPGHHYRPFRETRATFSGNVPLVNENESVAMGLLAGAGLLLLCARCLFWTSATGSRSPLDSLGILTVAGILLGTLGGIGALLTRLMPQIRAYNRISIYLTFFALFMVAACMEWFLRRGSGSKARSLVSLALILIVTGAALWDEIPLGFTREAYEGLNSRYECTDRFFKQVEASLEPGAMVYQLPHVRFPENPDVERMADYSHFAGYLHTRRTRWSYGSPKGTAAGIWHDLTGDKPVEELVPWLAQAGFNGIYVDTFGYADSGESIRAQLEKMLGVKPLVSEEGRRLFFPMDDYVRRQASNHSPEAWQALRRATVERLCCTWQSDFDPVAAEAKPGWWRGCSGRGTFVIANPSQRPRKIRLKLDWRATVPGTAPLELTSRLLPGKLKVPQGQPVSLEDLTIPPGRYSISMRCRSAGVSMPTEPGAVVFQVGHSSVEELD